MTSPKKYHDDLDINKSILSESEDSGDHVEIGDPFGHGDDENFRTGNKARSQGLDKLAVHINPFIQTKVVAELIQSINPNSWYNIPPPVTNSISRLCEVIKVLEKRFIETYKYQQERFQKQSNNTKRLEKLLADKEFTLQRQIEQAQLNMSDKIQRANADSFQRIEMAEQRGEELQAQVQRDRELVDTRLSRVDDSHVMKQWVDKQLSNLNTDLERKINMTSQSFQIEIDKIYQEQLYKEGLIGSFQQFKSLRDYSLHQLELITKSIKDVDKSLTSIIEEQNERLNTQLKKDRVQMDQKFEKETLTLTTTQAHLFEDLERRVKEKIGAIENQVVASEKNLDKDIFEAHQRIEELETRIEDGSIYETMVKKIQEKSDEIKKIKDQFNFEMRQLETKLGKDIEKVKRGKDSKQTQKNPKINVTEAPQLGNSMNKTFTNSSLVASFAKRSERNDDDESRQISQSPMQVQPPNLKFGDQKSLSPREAVQNQSLQEDSSIQKQRRQTLLPNQQDRLSRLQQNSIDNSQIQSKQHIKTINYQNKEAVKEENQLQQANLTQQQIENLITEKISEEIQQLKQTVNQLKAQINMIPSDEQPKRKDKQSFGIGYSQNQKPTIFTSKHSDRASRYHHSLDQTGKFGNDKNKQQFMQTMQNFSNYIEDNTKQLSQLKLDKNSLEKIGTPSISNPSKQEAPLLSNETRKTPSSKFNKQIERASMSVKNRRESNDQERIQSKLQKDDTQETLKLGDDSPQPKYQQLNQDILNFQIHATSRNNSQENSYQQIESQQISFNKSKLVNLKQSNLKTITKYEHDLKNTFKMPPILGNSSNTLRQTVQLHGGMMNSTIGAGGIGGPMFGNLMSLDRNEGSTRNFINHSISNESSIQQANHNYSLSLYQKQNFQTAHSQTKHEAKRNLNRSNNITSTTNGSLKYASFGNNQTLPISVKFERIDDRSFATKLERFQSLKRTKFPVINYLDYSVPDSTHDGMLLTTYEYPTQQNAKALLYFLPAYGDYCKNYGGFFKSFAAQGIRTLALDRRGFGMSQGARGLIHPLLYNDQWTHVDTGTFLRGFQHAIPKFLIGHSQGALMATRMLQQRPGFFAGCILISPFYEFSPKLGTFQFAKIRAQAMIKPKSRVDIKFNKDEELRQVYQHMSQSDPLYSFKWLSANILALSQDQKEVREELDKIDTPILMILGEKDQITESSIQKDIFSQIPIQDKQLIEYKDEDHFLMWWDGAQQKVEKDALQWLLKRIK